MYNPSIKIKNYKCFNEETGFDSIKRVNIIIGRNNVGKSALLDVIEVVVSRKYEFDQTTWRDNNEPKIIFKSKITEDVVKKTFPSNVSGGEIPIQHNQYGEMLVGREIIWETLGRGKETQLVSCDDGGANPPLKQTGKYADHITKNMPVAFEGKTFIRVSAERDIVPESASNSSVDIQSNGNGITNAIQCFINRSGLPSNLVEVEILSALNKIFAHDAVFADIVCQLHDSGYWEIYLEEEIKGRIALSKSGSGIKTVIAVLSSLFLIPEIQKKPLDQYVFGFEELENNIHPSLLRRLNDYIYRSSIENDFTYFITTHSNVLIDQFSRQDDAQIIHVTQENAEAKCNTAKTYYDNNGILDDLDVRASDLLQANGIVWVEGPSDRVYMNRWIDLWSGGHLREGTHYQIIFYGGRLLSHLSAESPDSVDSGISIFNANRNAVILIDSDKRAAQTKINPTKQRIMKEFEDSDSLCWVTKGREIENYIPAEVVDKLTGIDCSVQFGKYDSFFDSVDNLKDGVGKKYSVKKPLLAEELVQHMTKENMIAILDLDEKMDAVCDRIRSWNS